ncbi:MAG: GIY-YIG nuclease family protein [Bacteroidetes bacterium]|nr:GIY-YIG nuclease family protein [Bacteroidota bacterium]
MPFFTYILKSKIVDRNYIGSCSDLSKRLDKHNNGNSRSTKAFIPWEIVYFEEYATKSEALKREYALKRMKNKNYIKWLIEKYNSGGRPD